MPDLPSAGRGFAEAGIQNARIDRCPVETDRLVDEEVGIDTFGGGEYPPAAGGTEAIPAEPDRHQKVGVLHLFGACRGADDVEGAPARPVGQPKEPNGVVRRGAVAAFRHRHLGARLQQAGQAEHPERVGRMVVERQRLRIDLPAGLVHLEQGPVEQRQGRLEPGQDLAESRQILVALAAGSTSGAG